jgi:hypothetical protein
MRKGKTGWCMICAYRKCGISKIKLEVKDGENVISKAKKIAKKRKILAVIFSHKEIPIYFLPPFDTEKQKNLLI